MDPALLLACLILTAAIVGAVWLVTRWSGEKEKE